MLAEERRNDRVLCTYLDMRVCGDWLSAEPGKPGKPAADGGNRMWQRRVVTRRKTGAKTMDGKREKKKRESPGECIFLYK